MVPQTLEVTRDVAYRLYLLCAVQDGYSIQESESGVTLSSGEQAICRAVAPAACAWGQEGA